MRGFVFTSGESEFSSHLVPLADDQLASDGLTSEHAGERVVAQLAAEPTRPSLGDVHHHQLALEELLGGIRAQRDLDAEPLLRVVQTHEVEQLAAGHSRGNDLHTVDRNVNEKCSGRHSLSSL